MKTNFLLLGVIVFLFLAFGAYYFYSQDNLQQTGIENENTNQTEQAIAKNDDIMLYSPLPNEKISSPLTLYGEARGTWYFEASFPIVLTDWDGKIIAEGYATAQDDWMTEKFVPFEAVLEFEKPEMVEQYDRGSLILKKDNPSGLPENDDALELTVFFE